MEEACKNIPGGTLYKRISLLIPAVSALCCTQPLEPIAPSWDATFTLPLANRSYTLADIVRRDTSMLHVGTGNLITYTSFSSLTPTVVGDLITIVPPDSERAVEFGTFAVVPPALSLPFDIPWLPRGVPLQLPDTTVTLPGSIDTLTTFTSVVIDTGTIALDITNNLPVPVTLTDPIRILDQTGVPVAVFDISGQPIPASGRLRTAPQDLAGREIGNVISFLPGSVHVQGSPSPVILPQGPLFVVDAVTNGLAVRSAVNAMIPAQRLADNDTTSISVDDSTLIQQAFVGSGALHLRFANRVQVGMVFRFRFLDLQRPVGNGFVPFEDSVDLDPGGNGVTTIDLQGARMQRPDNALLSSLRVVSSVIIPSAPPVPVTINDTDKVVISVESGESIVIDSLAGVVKPTWVTVDETVPVNFGDLPTRFAGQFTIPSASLDLHAASSLGFPADLVVALGAPAPGGDSAYLSLPQSQRRVVNGNQVLHFDPAETGGFLTQVSGVLPDAFRVTGNILVNPPDAYLPVPAGVQRVGRSTGCGGSVALAIPLRLGITGGAYADTLVIADTSNDGTADFTINRDAFDRTQEGSVSFIVDNGIATSLGLAVHILDSLRTDVLRIPTDGTSLAVASAPVNPDGTVSGPRRSTLSVTLGPDDVRQLRRVAFVVYDVTIATPAGGIVQFRTSDAIAIRAWTRLTYGVNR